MKHSIILLPFILAACGTQSDNPVAPAATPQAKLDVPSPTTPPSDKTSVSDKISPTPSCGDQSIVGNWIGTNSLAFNDDCSALAGKNKLTWSVEGRDIIFTTETFQVDKCAYEVIASGGLTSPLIVMLDLICDKSGSLSYKKSGS